MKRLFSILFLTMMITGCLGRMVSVELETSTPTEIVEEKNISPTSSPPAQVLYDNTPTFAPASSCLPVQPEIGFSASVISDFPQAILNFLNQGGTPDRLADDLLASGFGNPYGPIAVADFTGDGTQDVAVSLIDPVALDQPRVEGVLQIYVCQDGFYSLAYDQTAEQSYSLGVHLWFWQDLNADGTEELVMSDALCGASTCFDNVKILAWDGNGFTNRLADRTDETDDLPSPLVQVADPDGDGVFDLVIEARGFGSVGAGPPRGKIRTWAYDVAQGMWVFASDILKESNFRIHILHDADTAAIQRDFDTALTFYERVVNDDTLQDWIDPPTEQKNLSAFALYRVVTIHLLHGDTVSANTVLTEMRNRFPPESAQSVYVDMALLYQATYPTGLETTCAVVKDFAVLNSTKLLDPLGSITYGYGNPDYSAEKLCFQQ